MLLCLKWKIFLLYILQWALCLIAMSKTIGRRRMSLCLPEIKKFFAIYLAMGIVRQCKLKDYSFECFKQADVYSFGLFLWELANRCMSGGSERKHSRMLLQLKSFCYISVKKFLLYIGHCASETMGGSIWNVPVHDVQASDPWASPIHQSREWEAHLLLEAVSLQ